MVQGIIDGLKSESGAMRCWASTHDILVLRLWLRKFEGWSWANAEKRPERRSKLQQFCGLPIPHIDKSDTKTSLRYGMKWLPPWPCKRAVIVIHVMIQSHL